MARRKDLQSLYESARNDLGIFGSLVYRTDEGRPLEAPVGTWHGELVDLLMSLEAGIVSPRAAKILGVAPGTPITRLNNNCPFGIGKSTWTSMIFPAWCLGRNPDLRFGIIANSGDNADLFSDEVRKIMVRPAYHAIFPDVRAATKGRGKKWSSSAWNIERHGDTASPSFSAFGRDSNITSRRFNILIFDDAADEKVSHTKYMRQKFSREMRENVITRVVEGGKILNIGTIRNIEDWHCELKNKDKWPTIRRPALYTVDMRMGSGDGDDKVEQETVDEMIARGAELLSICPGIFSVAGELKRRDEMTHSIYEITCQENVDYLHRTEGKYIQRPMLSYDAATPPEGAMIGIGVDCASTDKDDRDNPELEKIAFTVVVEGWRDEHGHLHIFGLEREQIGTNDQIALVTKKIKRWRGVGHEVVVGYEQAAGGKQQMEILQKEFEDDDGVHFDEELVPCKDKVLRSEPLRRGMEQGKTHFAPVFKHHEAEIVRFPDGRCDIIDASAWLAQIELEQYEKDRDEDDDEDFLLDDEEYAEMQRIRRRRTERYGSDREASELGSAIGRMIPE